MSLKKLFVSIVGIAIVVFSVHASWAKDTRTTTEIAQIRNELASYKEHHRPVDGWYYQAEVISGKNETEMFIICTNIQPQAVDTGAAETIGIGLKKNGNLVELEVPRKSAGAESKAGKYFTVKVIDGVPTTIFFDSEAKVIQHSLNT
ncbi:hypothetical protein H7Y21_02355 [Arenimonas sp.]|nr:hypothetical protein [Candidatus Parcubacteria bacterium]